MNERWILIILILILMLVLIIFLILASIIENLFFTLRIYFTSLSQQKNIKSFMNKYHLKFTIIRFNNMGEIRIKCGFFSCIGQIIKYIKLNRFFSSVNTLENAFFKILYNQNNIIIMNKINNNSIVNIKDADNIWDLVLDNIHEFLELPQLLTILKKQNFITEKQIAILLQNTELYNNRSCTNTGQNYKRNKRKVFDINNSTIKEFSNLPGITIITAKRLVKYRDNNGCFESVPQFWDVATLSLNQRIYLEQLFVFKAKKIKNKFIKKLTGLIKRNVERIVDI